MGSRDGVSGTVFETITGPADDEVDSALQLSPLFLGEAALGLPPIRHRIGADDPALYVSRAWPERRPMVRPRAALVRPHDGIGGRAGERIPFAYCTASSAGSVR
jgi:hypothetical protein